MIATRDGAAVFYEDAGSGDPPLVLVHGLGQHRHFAAQIEHFRRTHRVIALDLPGFGNSDAPPDREYGITTFAADVAGLCDEIGVRDAVFVGHSMGGAIAIELAAARPELAAALVLLDSVPIVPAPGYREALAAFAATLTGPGYREALRRFAESRMFRPTDDAAVRNRIVEEMCAAPQHVVAPALASIAAWQGQAVTPRVRAPMLLIAVTGGMPADIPGTCELLPELEVGTPVGAGHFAHVFVPEQVNAMIDRFLAIRSVGALAA